MAEAPGPGLAGARSPFLRHGAEQPVAWLPWGDEAFERARRENRPILLDIGAVWCHWCHVMDHESYEDPETAGLINEHYVPVKVDRDERPDVDARYQRAVQALSGQGGWPLTAILTPEGEVFYGGTYFPPDDRFGRPSFKRVLREVARIWREDPGRAAEAARSIRTHASAYAQAESQPGAVTRALVDRAVDAFAGAFDERHGGFGGAPKFPNAGALLLLLDRHLDAGDERTAYIVVRTLEAMGRGGVYDQLGGGFHRYSTDARWLVPHFEKMGYDNGVLLDAYARAHAVFGDPLFARVADGIIGYYAETTPALLAAGGFPASQDADVGPHDDGDYWTWTRDEIREALGGDERLERVAELRFGLDDAGATMPTDRDRHVLFIAMEPDEIAPQVGVDAGEAGRLVDEVARRLKAARARRERPYVDETVYSGWAALVASGHIAAARHLGREAAGRTALRALDRIWDEAFDAEDGVAHRLGDGVAGGYLEDQAYVAQALVDAFEWSQRPEYLERARRVVDLMLDRYGAPEEGAATSGAAAAGAARTGAAAAGATDDRAAEAADRPRGGALVDRPRDEDGAGLLDEPYLPVVDAPAPSGNAVAALTLLRLAALVHAPRLRERALGILSAFGGSAPQLATAVATYMRAVDWATSPVTTVVIVGEEGGETADALVATALRVYRPRTVVRRFAPGAVAEDELEPALRAMVGAESPRAYLCAGQTCAAPTAEPGELETLLRTFRG